MAKENFNVRHNDKTFKCYLEDGEVWFYDEKGNPTTTKHHKKISSIREAKEVAIDILNGFGR